MDNFIENKKIALFVVNLVSKMYHLDDAVLVEFHPASRFPNPEVSPMVTRDYRILYNIDRLKVAPDYELYITSFHEMRHIYQYCCIDFGHKLAFKKYFKEPKQRIKHWRGKTLWRKNFWGVFFYVKKSSKNTFYNSALRNQQRNYESANG